MCVCGFYDEGPDDACRFGVPGRSLAKLLFLAGANNYVKSIENRLSTDRNATSCRERELPAE